MDGWMDGRLPKWPLTDVGPLPGLCVSTYRDGAHSCIHAYMQPNVCRCSGYPSSSSSSFFFFSFFLSFFFFAAAAAVICPCHVALIVFFFPSFFSFLSFSPCIRIPALQQLDHTAAHMHSPSPRPPPTRVVPVAVDRCYSISVHISSPSFRLVSLHFFCFVSSRLSSFRMCVRVWEGSEWGGGGGVVCCPWTRGLDSYNRKARRQKTD